MAVKRFQNQRKGRRAFVFPFFETLIVKLSPIFVAADAVKAIKVMLEGLGKIGHVANSTHTVIGESMSAGRIYDKIGNYAYGVVKYVLPQGVICTLTNKSVMKGKENE